MRKWKEKVVRKIVKRESGVRNYIKWFEKADKKNKKRK